MNNLVLQIKKLHKKQKGFTLIELLIVIVIISALAVTVFTSLNPVKRIKDAHDSRRATDVETILSAVHSYIVDNNGSLPPTLALKGGNGSWTIGTCGGGCNATQLVGTYSPVAPSAFGCNAAAAASSVNLFADLGNYLKSVPTDPLSSSITNSYMITLAPGNIITITACYPEDNNGVAISQSR
jgi:prepilin-type N-terminal cleavage/methylation domain-containing protein